MARKLPLHPHLPTPELSQRARGAPNLVEARRWQLLAFGADDKTVTDAAALVGLNVYYARRVVRRYNREGPAGMRDRRLEQRPPVRPPLLSAEQQQELAAAVQGPAPHGGHGPGRMSLAGLPRRPAGPRLRPSGAMTICVALG